MIDILKLLMKKPDDTIQYNNSVDKFPLVPTELTNEMSQYLNCDRTHRWTNVSINNSCQMVLPKTRATYETFDEALSVATKINTGYNGLSMEQTLSLYNLFRMNISEKV